MEEFIQLHDKEIAGVISCFDRLIIQGTLIGCCYAQGMSNYLYTQEIKIFDYPKYAQSLRSRVRDNAEALAKENEVSIEFISKTRVRKEDVVKKVMENRGDHPGLVHIISVMESCCAYKPYYDNQQKKTYLKSILGKCLHYYFYFIDEQFGLCYFRVPTWCPFNVQFYCNGHGYLKSELDKKHMDYKIKDNAFTFIDKLEQAQELSDGFDVKRLHRLLERCVTRYCPILSELKTHYHWSIKQVEYATDILFKKPSELQEIYGHCLETAIFAIKSHDISNFLGRKLHGNYEGEAGSNLSTRVEGKRIKHVMGSTSIKMYDKFGEMLRIETTSNDISVFKHYREVERRTGGSEKKYAAMKKTIYSLGEVSNLLKAVNRRYLEYIASIDDISDGVKKLNKLSEKVEDNNRTYRGFNLFDEEDKKLFRIIIRGEFNIRGMSNKAIREKFKDKTSSQISRILKSLRLHGIIKKTRHSYRYYLTRLGRKIIAAGLKIQELMLVPALAEKSV